jgi:hypothetical protein
MALYPNPPSAFIDQYHGYGLIGIVGQNPSQPNFELQFSSSATTAEIQLVQTASASFDWVPYSPPPGPPKPDVKSFENSIWSDSVLTMDAKGNMANTFPLLENNINNPGAVQAYWLWLKQSAPAWLTPQAVDIIQAYAVEFKVPLLP